MNYNLNIQRMNNGWVINTLSGNFVVQHDGTEDLCELMDTIENLILQLEKAPKDSPYTPDLKY